MKNICYLLETEGQSQNLEFISSTIKKNIHCFYIVTVIFVFLMKNIFVGSHYIK